MVFLSINKDIQEQWKFTNGNKPNNKIFIKNKVTKSKGITFYKCILNNTILI